MVVVVDSSAVLLLLVVVVVVVPVGKAALLFCNIGADGASRCQTKWYSHSVQAP